MPVPVLRPRGAPGLWRLGVRLLVGALLLLLLTPAVLAVLLAYPPYRPLTDSPVRHGMAFEDVRFPSRTDGVLLEGWYIPAPGGGSGRTVVLAHGYLNDRLIHGRGLPIARALHDQGFGVVMFDLRGQGLSPGGPVTYGAREQGDIAGAFDFARQRGAHRVGVIGFSLGAAAAILAAGQEPGIGALVIDSAYGDLHRYLALQTESWTGGPGGAYALGLFRLFTGIDERTVSPEAAIPAIAPRPILIIHGGRDRVIPVAESRELYRAAANPRAELWVVLSGRHTHSYESDPGAYLARVVGFFETNLPRP